MKKLLLLILTLSCFVILASCGEPKHEHSYTKQETATCTEAGQIIYTCECGDSYTEEAPALGHELEFAQGKAATCSEEGVKDSYTCSRCNKVYADREATQELKSTKIDKLVHDIERTDAVDATCEEKGHSVYYQCKVCKVYFKDNKATKSAQLSDFETNPTGHTIKSLKARDVSCSQTGYPEHFECEKCHTWFDDLKGTNKVNSNITKELPHTITLLPAKEATCAERGNIAAYICSVCNQCFKDGNGTEALANSDVYSEKLPHNLKYALTSSYGNTSNVLCIKCIDCANVMDFADIAVDDAITITPSDPDGLITQGEKVTIGVYASKPGVYRLNITFKTLLNANYLDVSTGTTGSYIAVRNETISQNVTGMDCVTMYRDREGTYGMDTLLLEGENALSFMIRHIETDGTVRTEHYFDLGSLEVYHVVNSDYISLLKSGTTAGQMYAPFKVNMICQNEDPASFNPSRRPAKFYPLEITKNGYYQFGISSLGRSIEPILILTKGTEDPIEIKAVGHEASTWVENTSSTARKECDSSPSTYQTNYIEEFWEPVYLTAGTYDVKLSGELTGGRLPYFLYQGYISCREVEAE